MGTHPLDVAKKRFQVAGLQRSAAYGERVAAESVRSLAACLREIYAREGVGGFYKGALPSIIKAAPAAAVTFACYDLFMRALLARAEGGAQPPRRPPGH
jgi:solute carrier family 25 thiamine pyrophosphate transporter 19